MQFHYSAYAGYLIPKGWCVMASLTSVHLDAKNYENPFKFDPWRWEVSLENRMISSCFPIDQFIITLAVVIFYMVAENWSCG